MADGTVTYEEALEALKNVPDTETISADDTIKIVGDQNA